ncbi:2-dehydro-3-deoxy-D-gluconate 5-dehydrogenase KduD [Aurantimonas sp. VKM B-3413]|uniref:2-dehydro-3-deoxy-D-gluconate 5-dehydrogenase KduD n=1 Tax=Aurantimonas sp. VKM B-3413 TaxID=2779401 RepID=UPI001E2DBF5A|nr:2-dehydro-3-deoxy-D-gluconate 5-dehydrogenase KduD [Aurantimonas sp. VKM B-3413]MCB8839322.1 2-dehydro-3-deoxy-D-gluconate 5-dehydrogenase KduD [Aurantimonas sp. VKM B-3413]
MTSPFDLTGKRAFVTGANTGIGQGIALALAKAGAVVACAGRSSMAETLTLIADAGGRGSEHLADLADKDAAVALFETAAREGGPFDILVNNAGIIRRADATDFTEEDWDDVLDLNLKAAFFLAQAFGKSAIADGRHGAVVNIASVLTFQGGIRVASYTASKHGMAGITRLLACEWAGRDVNVNAIAPGYVVTNNTAALRGDEDRSAAILARIPAGRWGDPSDIGGAAVFLASDAARYIHGAILPVDGGWLAR